MGKVLSQRWCTSSKLIMASAFMNGLLLWQEVKLSSQRRYLCTVQERSRAAGGIAHGHLFDTTLCEMTWVNTVNGYKVTELAHKTDFMKNALLYILGGIYFNTDSIATKSFDDLLHGYQAVVSIQVSKMPGNGLLVAQKGSCFMCAFAKQACRNFDGHWDTHSVQTLDSLLATRLYKNVKVLEYANGFFPFGWNKVDVQPLNEEDMNTLPFSLLQVYAVHLYNSGVFTKIYRPNFYNYTWLIGSPSTAAHAIRAAFSSWFNETYFNVSLCIDPPVLSKSVW